MQKYNKDDNLRALWDAPQPNIDERQIAEALETFRRNRHLHISSNRRKKLFGSILRYAAIIVVPLLTALAAWNYSAQYYADENALVEMNVPDGKIDSVVLSDNTKLIVNAGTSVIYPARFNKHNYNRNVYVNGNCHFAVAKDPFLR